MPSQNITVTANNDDGFWQAAGFNNGAILNIVGSNGVDTHSFFRFQLSTTLPQGATITQADLKLTAVDTTSAALQYDAKCHISANSAQPTSFTDLNGRTYGAGVTFTNPATTGGAVFTHAIVAALQALVDAHTVNSGDYITIVLISQASATSNRRWICLDNGSGGEADLDLAWTDPPIDLTATFAGTTSTSSANLVTYFKPTATFAGSTLTGQANPVFNRKLTSTFNVITYVGKPQVERVTLPDGSSGGWEDAPFILSSWVRLSDGGDEYEVTWTTDLATFIVDWQTTMDANYTTFGGITVSGGDNAAGLYLEFTSNRVVGESFSFSVVSSNPPFPGYGETVYAERTNDERRTVLTVTRKVTSTFAATTTTGSAILGDLLSISAAWSATITTAAAMNIYVFPTTTMAGVVTTNTANPEFRRYFQTTNAGTVTTSSATMQTDRFAPVAIWAGDVDVADVDSTVEGFVVRKLAQTMAGSVSAAGEMAVKRNLEQILNGVVTTGTPVLGFRFRISNTWHCNVSVQDAIVAIYCRVYSTWQGIITTTGQPQFKHFIESQFIGEVVTGSAEIGNNRKLSATLAGSILPAGMVSVSRPIVSTFAAVTDTVGNAIVPFDFTSTFSGSVTTGAASIDNARHLSATFAGIVSTPAALLSNPITSTLAGVISTTGNCVVRKKLTAVWMGSIATAGETTTTKKVSSNYQAVTATNANNYLGKLITSTFAGSVSASASMTPRRKFASTFAVVVTTNEPVVTNRRKQIQTLAGLVETNSADPTFTRKFSATFQGSVLIVAVPLFNRKLSASFGSIVSTSGAATVNRKVTTTLPGSITTAAAVNVVRKLQHTFGITIETTGVVDVARHLSSRWGTNIITADRRADVGQGKTNETWVLPPRANIWVLPDQQFLDEGF